MSKRGKIISFLLATIVILILAFNGVRTYMIKRFFAGFEPPAVTVTAEAARAELWQKQLSATGQLVAVQGVDLTAEAAGIVKQIHFQAGQTVDAGTLLLSLDDDVDQAMLADQKAQLSLADITYQRQQRLYKQKATSSSVIDETRAKLEQAQAAVARIEALIAQKNIRAPFAGRLGIGLVRLGEYVNPGVTQLVTLQKLDPLHVEFSLPEKQLPHLSVGQTVQVVVEAYPERRFTGKISAIDAKIDEETRMLQVQGTLANPNQQLYPGMFARVYVLIGDKQNVITVPQTAIDYSLYGDSIFVISQEGDDSEPVLHAHRRYVPIGERRDERVAIREGLKAGEQVITTGQLKLQEGTRVEIAPAQLPRHAVRVHSPSQ